MTFNIRNINTRDTCINSIYIINTWIQCIDIGGTYTKDIYTRNALIRGIEPKVLIESKLILANIGVNI